MPIQTHTRTQAHTYLAMYVHAYVYICIVIWYEKKSKYCKYTVWWLQKLHINTLIKKHAFIHPDNSLHISFQSLILTSSHQRDLLSWPVIGIFFFLLFVYIVRIYNHDFLHRKASKHRDVCFTTLSKLLSLRWDHLKLTSVSHRTVSQCNN